MRSTGQWCLQPCDHGGPEAMAGRVEFAHILPGFYLDRPLIEGPLPKNANVRLALGRP